MAKKNASESDACEEDVSKLKVAELKVELKKLGISTAGNKAELLEKLRKVTPPISLSVPASESQPL